MDKIKITISIDIGMDVYGACCTMYGSQGDHMLEKRCEQLKVSILRTIKLIKEGSCQKN